MPNIMKIITLEIIRLFFKVNIIRVANVQGCKTKMNTWKGIDHKNNP